MSSKPTTHYEFINVQTGNIISHFSLPTALDKLEHVIKLNKEKVLLATAHKLGMDKIYWQDRANPISKILPTTPDKS